jgi:hypothetical protein
MYYVKSHTGPWPQGTLIEDADFDKHPFKAKYLRTGSVVKVSDAAAADMQKPTVDAERLAVIDAQIAELQAERAQVAGEPSDPTAPAAVTVEIDRQDPPTLAEADATRRAGKEVVQPTDRNVNLGEVVPGEAAGTTENPPADPPVAGALTETPPKGKK